MSVDNFASSVGCMPALHEVLICSCIICTSTKGSIWGDEVGPNSPGKGWASSRNRKARLAGEVTYNARVKRGIPREPSAQSLYRGAGTAQTAVTTSQMNPQGSSTNYRMVLARQSPAFIAPLTWLIFRKARGGACKPRPQGASATQRYWAHWTAETQNQTKPQEFLVGSP